MITTTSATIAVCHSPHQMNNPAAAVPTIALNRIVPSGTAGTTTAMAVITIASTVHSWIRAVSGASGANVTIGTSQTSPTTAAPTVWALISARVRRRRSASPYVRSCRAQKYRAPASATTQPHNATSEMCRQKASSVVSAPIPWTM